MCNVLCVHVILQKKYRLLHHLVMQTAPPSCIQQTSFLLLFPDAESPHLACLCMNVDTVYLQAESLLWTSPIYLYINVTVCEGHGLQTQIKLQVFNKKKGKKLQHSNNLQNLRSNHKDICKRTGHGIEYDNNKLLG